MRLRYPRFGVWLNGLWVGNDQMYDAADRRVGPAWAKTEGRDADIRRRYEAGETQSRIASLYDLDQATVSRIVSGDSNRPRGRYSTRRHVKRPTERELDRIAESICYVLEWKEHNVFRKTLPPWKVAKLCAVTLSSREENTTTHASDVYKTFKDSQGRVPLSQASPAGSPFEIYSFDCHPNGHVGTWWCARNHRVVLYAPTLKGLAVKVRKFRKREARVR